MDNEQQYYCWRRQVNDMESLIEKKFKTQGTIRVKPPSKPQPDKSKENISNTNNNVSFKVSEADDENKLKAPDARKASFLMPPPVRSATPLRGVTFETNNAVIDSPQPEPNRPPTPFTPTRPPSKTRPTTPTPEQARARLLRRGTRKASFFGEPNYSESFELDGQNLDLVVPEHLQEHTGSWSRLPGLRTPVNSPETAVSATSSSSSSNSVLMKLNDLESNDSGDNKEKDENTTKNLADSSSGLEINALKSPVHRKNLREKLRAAMKLRQTQRLQELLEASKKANLPQAETRPAEDLLKLLRLRDNLRLAMNNHELDGLRSVLKETSLVAFKELKPEVQRAQRMMTSLRRVAKLKTDLLAMDSAAWAEVRRYSKPHPTVHKVIIGALLLLGKSEFETMKWPLCQSYLSALGPDGLKRRIAQFDLKRLHPEIAARSKEILEPLDAAEVCDVSAGIGNFYSWAIGMLREFESRRNTTLPQPADLSRQRELLYHGLPPLPRAFKRRQYSWVRPKFQKTNSNH